MTKLPKCRKHPWAVEPCRHCLDENPTVRHASARRAARPTPTAYDAIAAVLNDHPHEPIPAFVYHTGGGVMAVRVDVTPDGTKVSSEGGFINDPPHLLITPRAEFDGGEGYAIGYYPTWEHTGEWPTGDTLRFAADLDGIHAIVMEGAEALCNGEAGA